MSNKYQEQYRIKSRRLEHWGYNTCGGYFVTLCIKAHQRMFGDIENGKMFLNKIGEEAEKIWVQIPKYFTHVHIDEYVFMPNHLHGNIMIEHERRDAIHGVSLTESPLKHSGFVAPEKNPMLNNSLSTLVRWYKARVTHDVHQLTYNKFQWQARFYDHVMRDDKDLNRVREYISNNPLNWEFDEENKERVKKGLC